MAKLDDTRKRLEDDIIDYAHAYAAYCMHKAGHALTETAWTHVMESLEAHQLALREDSKHVTAAEQ